MLPIRPLSLFLHFLLLFVLPFLTSFLSFSFNLSNFSSQYHYSDCLSICPYILFFLYHSTYQQPFVFVSPLSVSLFHDLVCFLCTCSYLPDRFSRSRKCCFFVSLWSCYSTLIGYRVSMLIGVYSPFLLHIINPGGLNVRDKSRSRSKTSIVSRLTFENRRDYPSRRDQLFFFLVVRFLKLRLFGRD